MPATSDGKTWRSQFYYEDWQGVRHKKNKRGFKTKAEAEEWERNFRQQQRKDLDINFENFVEIYFADMENRLRESTIKNKRYVFDLKVTPYFKKKKMCEIKTADIRAWQNELIKQGYAPTYLTEVCGFSTDSIIAFGDDYADIGMLELCGTGVAMGNAIDEVKERADLVIGSNDEDGIAGFIENEIL